MIIIKNISSENSLKFMWCFGFNHNADTLNKILFFKKKLMEYFWRQVNFKEILDVESQKMWSKIQQIMRK